METIRLLRRDSESWDHGTTLHHDGRITGNGGQIDHNEITPDDYDDPETVKRFLSNPDEVFGDHDDLVMYEWIRELTAAGRTTDELLDALEDGEYLSSLDATQDEVEATYDHLKTGVTSE